MKSQRKGRRKPKGVPYYDGKGRELWFRGTLVKRFKEPADVQELIFQAFQEQRWERVIDDPLPPVPGKWTKIHRKLPATTTST